MKMDANIILIIILHLLCFAGRIHLATLRCGFPGLPFRGNITPYKTEYDIYDKINYTCAQGYEIVGPLRTECNSNANWNIPSLPLCIRNYAFGGKTSSSVVDSLFKPDIAIDGNFRTCTKIKNSKDEPTPWWRISFGEIVYVGRIHIIAANNNMQYNISFVVESFKGKLETCGHISKTLFSGESLNQSVICNAPGWHLRIEDHRPSVKGRMFELCEVSIYSKPESRCGEPDINPNCLFRNMSTAESQRIEYYPKSGYKIVHGEISRECMKGKWIPQKIPHCSNGEKRLNATQNVNSNFIVGVAIGVTAASVSTIIVIIVVIVVMRKYYKRSGNQNGVSDADGIFLHVNPSSVGSGSPTIQPTYSRPWDDPALHTYEYIYSDTLPCRPQQQTIGRQKPDGELVSIDKANYLAHRNSAKRTWKNSGERTARRGLLDAQGNMTVPKQSNVTISSSNSSTLPVSCYNELEVDAYGYAEPEDTCNV